MQTLTLLQPDDAHTHLRDGIYLHTTVPDTAKQFARAIVMPNLKPPVTHLEALLAYKKRILAALPEGISFEPKMTLYLTGQTTPEDIIEASSELAAVKLYPAGVTTNSDAGVQNISYLNPVFATLEKLGIPLLIHGEVSQADVDIFDREFYFLKSLEKMIHDFPGLRIVLEHISTKEAVDFIVAAPANVAATITPQHLLLNRNDLLSGGIRPHYYCLPILKRREDQMALLKAATSGNPKFFLGTDSAPHTVSTKETACGCAGIYSAHAAIELYAQAFDEAGALDKLEAFASFHAADFYRWQRNTKQITLVKSPWEVPETKQFGEDKLTLLFGKRTLNWKILMS